MRAVGTKGVQEAVRACMLMWVFAKFIELDCTMPKPNSEQGRAAPGGAVNLLVTWQACLEQAMPKVRFNASKRALLANTGAFTVQVEKP